MATVLQSNSPMFQFSVHKLHLRDLRASRNNLAEPKHKLTLVQPSNRADESPNIRVERLEPNTNEFRITANLGNGSELGVKYSVSAWCGDSEVCDVKDQEARAPADSWMPLCVVDLQESIIAMDHRGEDDYLRIFLNVVVIDGKIQEQTDVAMAYEQQVPKYKLCDILTAQMFLYIAAKFIGF